MSFDVNRPPVDPPAQCQHRLLWRLARALWDAHRPDGTGFCVISACRRQPCLHPCRPAELAIEGLHMACTQEQVSPWIDVVREKIVAGHIDPVDAMAEVLWHHHQRRAAGG